ncbi:MAG: hypothetical protein MRY83_11890 [Flavobacteriales bacterium]|nr:hypothetical protein [Flavobacteriales bacterium]
MTFIDQIVQILLDFPLNTLRFFWNIVNPLIIEHWVIIAVTLVILINLAMIKFVVTGRWATLGSLLYNVFYFGILYFLIRFSGPEIILEDYFKSLSFLLYVIGFFLTRIILKSINAQNLSPFHFN